MFSKDIILSTPTEDEIKVLEKILTPYTKDFHMKALQTFSPMFKKHSIKQQWEGKLSDLNSIFNELSKKTNKKKAEYTEFIVRIMSDADNRKIYFDSLSENQRELWRVIYKRYFLGTKEYEEITGKSPIKKKERSYYYGFSTEVEYTEDNGWFSYGITGGWEAKEVYFYLEPEFRPILLDYFQDKSLLTGGMMAELPDEKLITFDGEAETVSLIPVLKELYLTGLLELGKSKITASTLKRITSTVEIREFFTKDHTDDKELMDIRSRMLLTTFALYGSNCILRDKKNAMQLPDAEILKDIIPHVKFYGLHLAVLLLPMLNRFTSGYTQESFSSEIIQLIIEILTALNKDERWLSYEALEERFHVDEKNNIFGIYVLPYKMENYGILNMTGGKIIRATNIFEQVGRPFIQGVLFMFASLGLIEIAYQVPEDVTPSPYAKLKYMRLTDLGRYAFDITKNYESNSNVKSMELFEVSDDKLLIRSLTDNNPYEVILKDIAQPIGNKRFVVTPESFLKNCKSEDQITQKISIFKKYISNREIPVWQNFFKEMIANANKIKGCQVEFTIYKIDSTDLRLHEIIATDPDIHDIALRAEDYTLLVRKGKQAEFNRIMKKHGYLF